MRERTEEQEALAEVDIDKANSSARCKACDVPFYPLWLDKHQAFEELCDECLTIIRNTDYTESQIQQEEQ